MHVLRSGGKYTREQQRFYEVKAAGSAIVAIILFFLHIFLSWILGLIFLGFGLHYLIRSRNWRKGILGEKRVVEALTPLDDSYVLINDVVTPGGKGNIDHILIGPNGVFVIETKNYSGEVTCKQDSWYKYSSFPIRSPSKQVKW